MALAVSRGEGGGAGGEDNHDEVANTVVFQPRIQQVFGPGNPAFFNIFEKTQARKKSTVQKTPGFFRQKLNKPVRSDFKTHYIFRIFATVEPELGKFAQSAPESLKNVV